MIDGKYKKWYYRIPIMAIWILAGIILVKIIFAKLPDS
jgi:hypothetical protein